MITIADILRPRHVELNLRATDEDAAIHEIASLLRGDERVRDWARFYEELKLKAPCVGANQEFEICIPHARTDSVSTMVMSVGRCARGIQFANETHKIRYVFVIGVPVALAADYLRIVGAIARIFTIPSTESELRQAATAEEVVSILNAKELKL
jgi:mannitol/fructose-specific phosphotransferase system IIA component (Ntr-type)